MVNLSISPSQPIGLSLHTHSDFSYALRLENHWIRAQTDWVDHWTGAPGRPAYMTLSTPLRASDQGRYLLGTPFLKFEDLGALREVWFSHTHTAQLPLSAFSTESLSTLAQVDTQSVVVNADAMPAETLCDAQGYSSSLTEHVDATQRVRTLTTVHCANHFSLCQDSHCGGTHKTRAVARTQTYTVPLYPSLDTDTQRLTDTTCVPADQPLGISLNGVPLLGISEFIDSPLYHTTPRECRKWTLTQNSTSYQANRNSTRLPVSVWEEREYGKALFGRTACSVHAHIERGVQFCGDVLPGIGRKTDYCGGFASREGGLYGYRMLPVCLLRQASEREKIEKNKT